jgi:hypothetical protein
MVVKKKFVDLSSGQILEVIDQFEDIAIMNNRSKVKVGNLLDKNLYEEYIDPNQFFRNDNLVNVFTEKIKQLPLDDNYRRKLEDVEDQANFRPNFSESAVLPYDPEEEKRELLEKARKMYGNGQSNANHQFERLSEFIEEDDQLKYTPPINKTSESEINSINEQQKTLFENNIQPMDPILSMFKNVKRNTDFNISFSITNKIPRLDFIEMMEDSYNTSIIEFLAEEFTNEILINPDVIKSKIIEEIKNMVYGEEKKETVTMEQTTKRTKKNQQPND